MMNRMETPKNQLTQINTTISDYLASPSGQNKLAQYIPNVTKRQDFQTAVVTMIANNPTLSNCDKGSIVSAALQAINLNFPLSNQLGLCYVVPYNSKSGVTLGQFQVGWKGYVQLAHRTGMLKKIIVSEIKENELVSHNPITQETVLSPIMDFEKRDKAPTIGYYAKIVTVMGFEQELYWALPKMEKHAKKYSKSYSKGYGSVWNDDFDTMGRKTVLKKLLQTAPMMSENHDLQRAIEVDQAVLEEDGTITYVDNTGENKVPSIQLKPITESSDVPFPELESKPISTEKLNYIQDYMKKLPMDKVMELNEWISKTYQTETINDLTDSQATMVISQLTKPTNK